MRRHKLNSARRAYRARRAPKYLLASFCEAARGAESTEIGDGVDSQFALQEQWKRMGQALAAQEPPWGNSQLVFETPAEVKEAESDTPRHLRQIKIDPVMLCAKYL